MFRLFDKRNYYTVRGSACQFKSSPHKGAAETSLTKNSSLLTRVETQR